MYSTALERQSVEERETCMAEVKLQSRTHRVAPSNEFFKLIGAMGGVNFSVN